MVHFVVFNIQIKRNRASLLSLYHGAWKLFFISSYSAGKSNIMEKNRNGKKFLLLTFLLTSMVVFKIDSKHESDL